MPSFDLNFDVTSSREAADGTLSLTVRICDNTGSVPPYSVVFNASTALLESWPLSADDRRAEMLLWLSALVEERHEIEAESYNTSLGLARQMEPDEVSTLLRGSSGKATSFSVHSGVYTVRTGPSES